MRSLQFLGVATLSVLLLAACGGSGGGDGLNPAESELVGDYVLVDFDVMEGNMWSDASNYVPWSGSMVLEANGDATVVLEKSGVTEYMDLRWSADASTITFVNPTDPTDVSIFSYSFDGTNFNIDRDNADVGEDERYYFVVTVIP